MVNSYVLNHIRIRNYSHIPLCTMKRTIDKSESNHNFIRSNYVYKEDRKGYYEEYFCFNCKTTARIYRGSEKIVLKGKRKQILNCNLLKHPSLERMYFDNKEFASAIKKLAYAISFRPKIGAFSNMKVGNVNAFKIRYGKIGCSIRPFDCFNYRPEHLCGFEETECKYSIQ